jgi:aminopeptidase
VADPLWPELAETLLAHSIRLQPGESVLIESFDLPDPDLIRALVRGVARRRGQVLVASWHSDVLRDLIRHASADQALLWAAADRDRMERVDAYIALRGDANPAEWAEVPPAAANRYNELYLKPVHWDLRIPAKRWCHVRLPGPFLAQMGGMGRETFEAMYRAAVLIDHPRFRRAMEPLADRIGAARRVRITGPETDLRFDLTGGRPIVCAGEKNLPDGEVFTAPVLDSVEGRIVFNAKSLCQGRIYEGISLEFQGGRVVRAGCRSGDPARLNRILDVDEGARRVGEWAIGCNPFLGSPVGDPHLDEKVAGSHHLALGFAYPEADNGNRSRIHLDLVQMLLPEWGGGRIELDGEALVIDGSFVDLALAGLNPGA